MTDKIKQPLEKYLIYIDEVKVRLINCSLIDLKVKDVKIYFEYR